LIGFSATPGSLVSCTTFFSSTSPWAEKQAAAWQYLKFLDSPESLTTWAIGTGYLPIRKASAESSAMQQYWQQNPSFKVAYDQLANGPENAATAGPVIGAYQGVRDAVINMLEAILITKKDVATAVSTAVTTANAAIQAYNDKLG